MGFSGHLRCNALPRLSGSATYHKGERHGRKSGGECALDCMGGLAQALTFSMLGFNGQLVELLSTINSAQHQNAFDRGLTLHQLSLGAGHVNGEKGMKSITQAGIAMNNLLYQSIIASVQTNIIALSDIPDILKKADKAIPEENTLLGFRYNFTLYLISFIAIGVIISKAG